MLAACFFGADFALTALGNSAKARTALPPFLGGLELYFLLMPGVASAALGVLGFYLARLSRPSR